MRAIQELSRFSRFLAVVLALVAICRPARAQILENYSTSLTTYKPTGNTTIQGVRPLVVQRGTTLDGVLRSQSSFPMVIGGNPFENAWNGREFMKPLRIDTGTYAPLDVDIALPTLGIPWVIGRTYNAVQQNSGGSSINSNGYQGKNWFQTSQPEILFYDDADNAKDELYLVYGADRFVEFVRKNSSSNQFKGRNGAGGCFDYQTGSPDVWVFTDEIGNVWKFFGFNTTSNATDGQFWKVTDPAGNVAFVGDATTASTAISNGYSSGKITTAYDASDRRFTYTYTTLDSVSRLTQVKAETKTGGTWASSPTGVATAVKVDYTYYTSETHGDIGDLKQVKITTRLNDSGGETDEQVKRKYYRYWEGSSDDTASYNSSTNPGYPHALKYVYDFEGVREYDWLDSTFDEDHLTESDANLASYAAAYFEYDSSHRVRTAWFEGQCGCGGASNGTFSFTYGASGYTNNAGYDTAWATRTVIAKPDTSYLTRYFDEAGQGLSEVVSDIDPGTGSPSFWVTNIVRDSTGCVTEIHTPENLNSYTHSSGVITPKTSNDGLVRIFTRATSGDMTGFATDWKHQLGWDPSPPTTVKTKYFDGSQTITSLSKTITDVIVVRPLLATTLVYSQETTSLGGTGSYTTTYSYNDYSAASQPLTIQTSTTTHPTVTSGNNGSGSATSANRRFRKDGLIDWRMNEDLSIDYWEYSNGQNSRQIRDGDTGLTGTSLPFDGVTAPTSPINFSAPGSPTKITDVSSTSFTSQGFRSQEVAFGLTIPTYRSVLADGRLIQLRYSNYTNSGTATWYGPVTFTVLNQAGKVEASGIVALTSNNTTSGQDNHIDETKSDPIQALALGTVAQMRTSVYGEAGTQLSESRTYFLIPGSGAGSAGTNYDATTFAYDDSGHRIRTKDPSGTIRRNSFDIFNRITDASIGTNDHGLSGGESSGSSNMVTTEVREYDGGSVGLNGNLTKIKRYTDASNHDDTTLSYDYRGRMILETPPLAPFAVHKFDNMGREIAVGDYSSSSGLTTSTDPTSTATNRMALSETLFDEKGQVWETIRHKIDDADGSDDDTLLTLNWYDERGQLIKVDGDEAKKIKYDGTGRVTDEYILAKDDDAAYSDVYDSTYKIVKVGGDIVLEQRETRFDSTAGTVLLSARIDRFHSDYGGGETTTALDTNADSGTPDSLKLTAADVLGRVQITAKWYDSLNRPIDQVEYGTYGGSTFDRNGLSAPSRSDTALRTTWTYNTDGTIDTIADPRALVTRRTYDAQGRLTKEVKNYDAGVNSGNPYGTDQNVTVSYGFTNGLRTSLTANMQSGGDDQVTTYIYGSTSGTPSQMKIATGHLLRAVKYPDSTNGGTTVANIASDSSDVVSFAYDAQSRETYKKDQDGNVIETDIDGDGRATQKRATNVAGGYDTAIKRIATIYDSIGRTSEIVQYDNATVGSGTAQDGIKYTYDDWGPISKYEEDRDSAVTGGGNQYATSYTYAKATTGRNSIQKSTMTMPDSRSITYNYSTTSGLHDGEVNRVTSMSDGGTTLTTYNYNGAGQVVGTQYDQPDAMWNLYTTTGVYPDLDRFNRVVKSRWTKDLGTDVDFYHVELGYDRDSGIVSAQDAVHAGMDVVYTMDNVNRLTEANEGTLSGGSITSATRDELWTLSHTGNWDYDKVDLNGDGDFVDTNEVNDHRAHDKVNQLNTRDTDNNGSTNYTLSYDGAGDLTDDGQSYKYEYDAFLRLRKVKTQASALVAEYRYNGLGHKIGVHEDTDSDGDVDSSDKWYYDAFDERWRVLARYRESDSSPKEDFVPHQAGLDGNGESSYIDLVVCRNKDANTAWTSASDGTLEQRRYYCQNWRADVSALLTSSGTMLEWDKYSAYGIPFGLPGGDSDSNGKTNAADLTQVQTWINTSHYDVRGDIDLDGDVDATDKATINVNFTGITLGRGSLSASGVSNRKGYAAYEIDAGITSLCHVRYRVLHAVLGQWIQRDPEGYVDGMALCAYARSAPMDARDPLGLEIEVCNSWIDCIFACLNGIPLFDSTRDQLGGSRRSHSFDVSSRTPPTGPQGGKVGGQTSCNSARGSSSSEVFTPNRHAVSTLLHEMYHAKECDDGKPGHNSHGSEAAAKRFAGKVLTKQCGRPDCDDPCPNCVFP